MFMSKIFLYIYTLIHRENESISFYIHGPSSELRQGRLGSQQKEDFYHLKTSGYLQAPAKREERTVK